MWNGARWRHHRLHQPSYAQALEATRTTPSSMRVLVPTLGEPHGVAGQRDFRDRDWEERTKTAGAGAAGAAASAGLGECRAARCRRRPGFQLALEFVIQTSDVLQHRLSVSGNDARWRKPGFITGCGFAHECFLSCIEVDRQRAADLGVSAGSAARAGERTLAASRSRA